ncbi:MAG: hypothetical protein SD837_09130 [Candidatus Electrothrix scaldis]|nr:MAG: hypothetical protein SD837_09130 [Candidatus Electrothrix sp. GW3-3]
MNKYLLHILLCSTFLCPPLVQAQPQDNLSFIQQKQQEMIQANRAKNMAAKTQINSQLAGPLAEPKSNAAPGQDSEYMFRFKMRKMMQEKMRQSGQSLWGWEPTAWQKTLPAIVVQDKGATKSYSFTDLIEADGYLCPGSARAYKALQVALPILYKDSTPVKGDFKIIHGPALCTSLVYDFFMEGYTDKTDKTFLELDSSLKKKLISIERLSTGKKVTVIFPPSNVRGHDQVAAEAGDAILHAQEGKDMHILIEER